MLDDSSESTVFEGTRDEIVARIQALPDERYQVEVVGLRKDEAPPIDTLDEAIRKLRSRTPEKILADRAEIIAGSPAPRPLPSGMTLEEVVAGTWPGQETDDEIREALERLS